LGTERPVWGKKVLVRMHLKRGGVEGEKRKKVPKKTWLYVRGEDTGPVLEKASDWTEFVTLVRGGGRTG